MKVSRWIILLAPVVLLAAGQEKAETSKTKKKAPTTLPAEAVQIEPYTYRYKDPEGKIWIYRRTPFGLTKYEEAGKGEPKERTSEPASGIKAFEEGDQVRFERNFLTGKHTWVKKITELDEFEKAALEEARQASSKEKSTQE
jgi:hypothetical protein